MAVNHGMFCLNAKMTYKCKMLSVIKLEWSESMGTYNTQTL